MPPIKKNEEKKPQLLAPTRKPFVPADVSPTVQALLNRPPEPTAGVYRIPETQQKIEEALGMLGEKKGTWHVTQEANNPGVYHITNKIVGQTLTAKIGQSDFAAPGGAAFLVATQGDKASRTVRGNLRVDMTLDEDRKNQQLNFRFNSSITSLARGIHAAFKRAGGPEATDVNDAYRSVLDRGDPQFDVMKAPIVSNSSIPASKANLTSFDLDIHGHMLGHTQEIELMPWERDLAVEGYANLAGRGIGPIDNIQKQILKDPRNEVRWRDLADYGLDVQNSGLLRPIGSSNTVAVYDSAGNQIGTKIELATSAAKVAKRRSEPTETTTTSDPYEDVNGVMVKMRPGDRSQGAKYFIPQLRQTGDTSPRAKMESTIVYTKQLGTLSGGALAYDNPNDLKASMWGAEKHKDFDLQAQDLRLIGTEGHELNVKDLYGKTIRAGSGGLVIGTQNQGSTDKKDQRRLIFPSSPTDIHLRGAHGILPPFYNKVTGEGSNVPGENMVPSDSLATSLFERTGMPFVVGSGTTSKAMMRVEGSRNMGAVKVYGPAGKFGFLFTGKQASIKVGGEEMPISFATAEAKTDALISGAYLPNLSRDQQSMMINEWAKRSKAPGGKQFAKYFDTNIKNGKDPYTLSELSEKYNEFAGNAPGTEGYVSGSRLANQIVENVILDAKYGTKRNTQNIERYGAGYINPKTKLPLGAVSPDALQYMKENERPAFMEANPGASEADFEADFNRRTPRGKKVAGGDNYFYSRLAGEGAMVMKVAHSYAAEEGAWSPRENQATRELLDRYFPKLAEQLSIAPGDETNVSRSGVAANRLAAAIAWQTNSLERETGNPRVLEGPDEGLYQDVSKDDAFFASTELDDTEGSYLEKLDKLEDIFGGGEGVMRFRGNDAYLPRPSEMKQMVYEEGEEEYAGLARDYVNAFKQVADMEAEGVGNFETLWSPEGAYRKFHEKSRALLSGRGETPKSRGSVRANTGFGGSYMGSLAAKAGELLFGKGAVDPILERLGIKGEKAKTRARKEFAASSPQALVERTPVQADASTVGVNIVSGQDLDRVHGAVEAANIAADTRPGNVIAAPMQVGEIGTGDLDLDKLKGRASVWLDKNKHIRAGQIEGFSDVQLTPERAKEVQAKIFPGQLRSLSSSGIAGAKSVYEKEQRIAKELIGKRTYADALKVQKTLISMHKQKTIAMGTGFNLINGLQGAAKAFGLSEQIQTAIGDIRAPHYQFGLDFRAVEGRNDTGTQLSKIMSGFRHTVNANGDPIIRGLGNVGDHGRRQEYALDPQDPIKFLRKMAGAVTAPEPMTIDGKVQDVSVATPSQMAAWFAIDDTGFEQLRDSIAAVPAGENQPMEQKKEIIKYLRGLNEDQLQRVPAKVGAEIVAGINANRIDLLTGEEGREGARSAASLYRSRQSEEHSNRVAAGMSAADEANRHRKGQVTSSPWHERNAAKYLKGPTQKTHAQRLSEYGLKPPTAAELSETTAELQAMTIDPGAKPSAAEISGIVNTALSETPGAPAPASSGGQPPEPPNKPGVIAMAEPPEEPGGPKKSDGLTDAQRDWDRQAKRFTTGVYADLSNDEKNALVNRNIGVRPTGGKTVPINGQLPPSKKVPGGASSSGSSGGGSGRGGSGSGGGSGRYSGGMFPTRTPDQIDRSFEALHGARDRVTQMSDTIQSRALQLLDELSPGTKGDDFHQRMNDVMSDPERGQAFLTGLGKQNVANARSVSKAVRLAESTMPLSYKSMYDVNSEEYKSAKVVAERGRNTDVLAQAAGLSGKVDKPRADVPVADQEKLNALYKEQTKLIGDLLKAKESEVKQTKTEISKNEKEIAKIQTPLKIASLQKEIADYNSRIAGGEGGEVFELRDKAIKSLGSSVKQYEKAMATPEGEKSFTDKLGSFARKALGNFGLMYMRSIFGLATQGLGQGQDERLALESETASARNAYFGTKSVTVNQQQQLANATALYGQAVNPLLTAQMALVKNPTGQGLLNTGVAAASAFSSLSWAGVSTPWALAGTAAVALGSAGLDIYQRGQDPNGMAWRIGAQKGRDRNKGVGTKILGSVKEGWDVLGQAAMGYDDLFFGTDNSSRFFYEQTTAEEVTAGLTAGKSIDQIEKDLWSAGTPRKRSDLFASTSKYLLDKFGSIATVPSASRAATFMMRDSGRSYSDKEKEALIADYNPENGVASEDLARGMLGSLGYSGAALSKNLVPLTNSLRGQELTLTEKDTLQAGSAVIGSLSSSAYISGVGAQGGVADIKRIEKLVEDFAKLATNPAGLALAQAASNAYQAQSAIGLAPKVWTPPTIAANIGQEEAAFRSAQYNADETAATKRRTMATEMMNRSYGFGDRQAGDRMYKTLTDPNRDVGTDWFTNRLLNEDPLAYGAMSRAGVNLNAMPGLKTMNGTTLSAAFSAFTDFGMNGQMTGMGWGTTSLNLGGPGGISGANMAKNIWGANFSGNAGLHQGLIDAMVNGVKLDEAMTIPGANGKPASVISKVGGEWGAQRFMNDRQWAFQQEGFGIQERGRGSEMAFTTGIGLAGFNGTVNPVTGKPFGNLGATGGFWGLEDAGIKLQSAQADWQYDFNKKQTAVQENQWQTNFGMNIRQAVMQRGWTKEDWGYQQQTRDLQWGWKQEDFAEESRFMTGRQRRLAERQNKRDVTMHNLEGDQIDKQKNRQEVLWKLEDQRFQVEREQHAESLRLQIESMEKNREFYLEEKKLREQQLMLSRAYWVVQQGLSKESAALSKKQAIEQHLLNETMIDATQYTTALSGAMKTLTDDAFMKLIDKMIQLTGVIAGIVNSQVAAPQIPVQVGSAASGLAPVGYGNNTGRPAIVAPVPTNTGSGTGSGGTGSGGTRPTVVSRTSYRQGVVSAMETSERDIIMAAQDTGVRATSTQYIPASAGKSKEGDKIINIYLGNEHLKTFVVNAVVGEINV